MSKWPQHRSTRVTHGLSHSPEWIAWRNMIRRCTNPNDPSYSRYGALGITVCARWVDPVEGPRRFIEDVGVRPDDGYSLERIDTGGNYEPGNVKWATAKEQARNRSNNKLLTLDGETMPMAAWAERYGINVATLGGRIKRGWGLRRALTERRGPNRGLGITPAQKKAMAKMREGGAPWPKIANRFGVSESTVRHHVVGRAASRSARSPR